MLGLSKVMAAAACLTISAGMASAALDAPQSAPKVSERIFEPGVLISQARSPQNFGSGVYISPNGCAYRRTQAPGSPPLYILIQNPHHLGLPNNTGTCATTL